MMDICCPWKQAYRKNVQYIETEDIDKRSASFWRQVLFVDEFGSSILPGSLPILLTLLLLAWLLVMTCLPIALRGEIARSRVTCWCSKRQDAQIICAMTGYSV